MIAIIPARGGSKGLPGKNIKEMCGKPLIAYTIEAALGHNQHDVTSIYIEFDMRKVDEANRKVLDYVLYDKR